MSGHATAEGLSRYLDRALPAAERRRVEEHLDECPDCRHRLTGLGRVVEGLARLPTAAPPEDLAARVAREIDLRRGRSRWGALLAGGPPRPLLGAPPLHLLALVLALGAIVYLYARGLEVSRERPTRLVLPRVEEVVVEPPADAPGSDLRLLGGRFERLDGVWVERGLAGRAPDTRVSVDAGGPGAAAVPELAELAALGAPLRLRVGREVVEIAVAPAADPAAGGPRISSPPGRSPGGYS